MPWAMMASLGFLCLLRTTSASISSPLFCERPAVCTEAVCQRLEEPQDATAKPRTVFESSPQREVAYLDTKLVCPPDRNDIGRAMWTILHTTAAYYPQNATEDQQRKALGFINALPELYPCEECAHHLASCLDEMPPRLETREEFSLWVCELHNRVNARTGKEARPCTLRELDEAWRTPSQACLDAREKLHAVTAQQS